MLKQLFFKLKNNNFSVEFIDSKNKKNKFKYIFIISFLSIILLFSFVFFILPHFNKQYSNILTVELIDVGQGDSIYINTPSGKNILIDSGEKNFFHNVKQTLQKNHVKKLDLIFCTHNHSDHIGCMSKIVDKYKVNQIFLPPQKSDTEEYYSLISSCNKKNIDIQPIWANTKITLPNIIITILNPSKIVEDPNENSIVFLLNFKNQNLLFTGDATKNNENSILSNYKLPKIDFFKVPHHGSDTSSCDNFIKTIQPTVSAISCGYKNKFGHPKPQTLNTLKKYNSKIYRTDVNGNMIFLFDGNTMKTSNKYKYK